MLERGDCRIKGSTERMARGSKDFTSTCGHCSVSIDTYKHHGQLLSFSISNSGSFT